MSRAGSGATWIDGEGPDDLLDHAVVARVAPRGLEEAAMAGELSMVQALLDKGADLDARLHDTNESAATLAASHGYDDIARLLSQID